MIKIKRIYEQPSKEDGYRILIDRLWPRGLSKEKAEVIPSVIVECGYIDQDYNGKKINDVEIQTKYASLIARGIENYFFFNLLR